MKGKDTIGTGLASYRDWKKSLAIRDTEAASILKRVFQDAESDPLNVSLDDTISMYVTFERFLNILLKCQIKTTTARLEHRYQMDFNILPFYYEATGGERYRKGGVPDSSIFTEEAIEYMDFNVLCAYIGKDQPIFLSEAYDEIE